MLIVLSCTEHEPPAVVPSIVSYGAAAAGHAVAKASAENAAVANAATAAAPSIAYFAPIFPSSKIVAARQAVDGLAVNVN
jgi:hypothetical protein